MTQKEAFDLVLYKFIDAYVDLYGEINTVILTNQFHMHRTKASKIFTQYKKHELNGNNLRFDEGKAKYVRTATFKKNFLLDDSSLFFLNSVEVVHGCPKVTVK